MQEQVSTPTLRRTPDPFVAARAADGGATEHEFHGERLVMLLRWKDVRNAARKPARFDSGQLGRVPIPPETGIRSFKQLPIETNPPEHGAWRDIVLPFFRRPVKPGPRAEMEGLVAERLNAVLDGKAIDVVSEVALPIQSAALAVLLDTDRSLAAEWEGWGLHALRTDGKTDPAKSARFLDFIDRMLDRGQSGPDMGLFTHLHTASFDGRPLTRDEMRGICHLALAGGRDTIIHAVTGTVAHMAATPSDLAWLRAEPARILKAAEEMFRVLSPLAQIGRVCPGGLEAGPHVVAPGDRAALCWAAANRDPDVFDAPEEIRLDRTPNPHVAFGAGTHSCLGAPMARLVVRKVLEVLSQRVKRIEVIEAVPRSTVFGTPYLFETLTARLIARRDSQRHSTEGR